MSFLRILPKFAGRGPLPRRARRRFWLVTGLIFCGGLSAARAQAPPTVVLRGVVRDSASNETMPYASVGVVGTGLGALTDEQGVFVVRVPAAAVKNGSVRLAFLSLGYRRRVVSVAAARAKAPAKPVLVHLALNPNAQLTSSVPMPDTATRRGGLGRWLNGKFGKRQASRQ